MGNEFLNKSKGAIRKCRDKQKEKIATELMPIVDEIQVISVKLLSENTFCEGHKFEVTLEKDMVGVYHERNLVGFSKNISPKLAKDIEQFGGRALGVFDKFRPYSKQLDISVCIKKD